MANSYILDEDGNELSYLKVFSVKSIEQADLTSAPIEDGQQSFDNITFLPMKVIVDCTSSNNEDENNDDEKIHSMLYNKDFKFYTVVDGDYYYSNLKIESIDISHSSDTPDFTHYTITYKEIILVQSSSSAPSNSENTNTRANGRAASA